MVRFSLVLNRCGLIVLCIAPFMLAGIPFSVYYRTNDIRALLWSAVVTAAAGGLLYLLTPRGGEVGHREGICIVALGWTLVAAFGALPFYFQGTFATYTDAFFESMSGFTTTGASVLADIEKEPAGILFWRDLTQWLGGMGIVVLSLAVLPVLGAGGMQLYKAEVPGPTADKLVPRVRETAKRLYVVYAAFTLAEVLLLWIGGMTLFEAFTNTFGTLATGGYSPRNASIGTYGSAYIDVVVIAFMFIAGANFLLHYHALTRRDVRVYLRDEEFRFYLGALVVFTLTLSANLLVYKVYPTVLSALRYGAFATVSIMTTTGFATADFEQWPTYAHYALLLMMFVGGCAGSTGGAIKCVRIWLLMKMAYAQVFRIVHPKAVRTVRFNGRVVPPEILQGVQAMFFLFLGVFVAASLALAWLGLDMVTAIAAVAATLGNIGPGLGTVGPVDNYAHFSVPAKWICALCMLVGRLEVYSVVALFFPEFWRK